jgi:flagellar protein FliS
MKKSLRDGIADNKKEPLISVKNNLQKLRDAYDLVVSKDESAPVMTHTQTVVAGLTYGRNALNENLTDAGSNRGFCV